MSILTRIKDAAVKTKTFIDENATEIRFGALTVAAAGTLWLTTEILKDNVETRKRLSNAEVVIYDLVTHPTFAEKNEDGSFTVTRLSKRKTEDTPV